MSDKIKRDTGGTEAMQNARVVKNACFVPHKVGGVFYVAMIRRNQRGETAIKSRTYESMASAQAVAGIMNRVNGIMTEDVDDILKTVIKWEQKF